MIDEAQYPRDPRTRIVNPKINPLLQDLPEKFGTFRPQQISAVSEAVEAFDSGVKVVVIDAPTGTGKTLIGELVRRELGGKASYVCHNKELQSQFVRDFPGVGALVFGRSNYTPTNAKNFPMEVTCVDCDWSSNKQSCTFCDVRSACPYQVAKEQCLGGQVAVVNSSYWLAETQVGGGGGSRLAKRPLTIFDEADTLESVLMGTVEIYISEYAQKKFNIKPPKKMTKEEEHVEWVRETIAHLQGMGFGGNRLAFASSVKESRDLRQGERLLQSLRGMAGDIEAGSRWVYTGGAGSDRRRGSVVSFKPVNVSQFGRDRIWGVGDEKNKFLLMSGTIVSPGALLNELGYDGDWHSVRLESSFHPKNRQVVVRPVADMTKKGQDNGSFGKLADELGSVLRGHAGQRGVVHSVSYALADKLVACCERDRRGRVFTYRMAEQRAASIAEFRRVAGSVLVAPSAERGVDLPGDQCRFQVIAKVPYVSLGDQQVSARLYGEGGAVWYNVQVARAIMQMVGRGVRGEDDWCVCYVLDKEFVRWRSQWGGLFPKWFNKAVRLEV